MNYPLETGSYNATIIGTESLGPPRHMAACHYIAMINNLATLAKDITKTFDLHFDLMTGRK